MAYWLHLDLATSLSVGLLVAIAGMTFGLMVCDALEEEYRPDKPSNPHSLQETKYRKSLAWGRLPSPQSNDENFNNL